MRRITWEAIGWLVIWLLVALFVLYANQVEAQDTPHISTTFEVTCLEALSEDHYRLHISYTSDGVEAFTFAMGEVIGSSTETLPYSGHAETNISQSFVTEVGTVDEWYLDAHSEDSPYTFYLLFTNDVGTAVLPVNTWEHMNECEVGIIPIVDTVPTVHMVTTVPIVTTGYTCTIKYPEIILVCNG